jgi:SAM-dependent methyltransferase
MKGLDFKGKRVLDIGCRDGAMSFASETMEAGEIVAIDNSLPEGLTEFLIPIKNSKIRCLQYNVNDLSRNKFGEFDIILFPGVLYHLRYPIWSLRRIADVLKPGGTLILEGGFIEGFGDLPILFCPIGTDSPFEITSVTFFNEAGITDTLMSLGFSDIQLHDTYSHTFTEQGEIDYLSEKFPKYFKEYEGRHKISVCRKLFSCVKKWSHDKKINSFQIGTSKIPPDTILHEYWDGVHAFNTWNSVKSSKRSALRNLYEIIVSRHLK